MLAAVPQKLQTDPPDLQKSCRPLHHFRSVAVLTFAHLRLPQVFLLCLGPCRLPLRLCSLESGNLPMSNEQADALRHIDTLKHTRERLKLQEQKLRHSTRDLELCDATCFANGSSGFSSSGNPSSTSFYTTRQHYDNGAEDIFLWAVLLSKSENAPFMRTFMHSPARCAMCHPHLPETAC